MTDRQPVITGAHRDVATIEREIAGLRRNGCINPLTRMSLIEEKRLEIAYLKAKVP